MMNKISFSEEFYDNFKTFGNYSRRVLLAWILDNIYGSLEPLRYAEVLGSDKENHYRFKVGIYHLIAILNDDELIFYYINKNRFSSKV